MVDQGADIIGTDTNVLNFGTIFIGTFWQILTCTLLVYDYQIVTMSRLLDGCRVFLVQVVFLLSLGFCNIPAIGIVKDIAVVTTEKLITILQKLKKVRLRQPLIDVILNSLLAVIITSVS